VIDLFSVTGFLRFICAKLCFFANEALFFGISFALGLFFCVFLRTDLSSLARFIYTRLPTFFAANFCIFSVEFNAVSF